MKVIICGPRILEDDEDYEMLCDAIEKSGFEISEVISGKAKCIDTLGERWAFENNVTVRGFPAKWKELKQAGAVIKENQYGKYNANAGFFRNMLMAEYGEALIAIVNGSYGTANMVKQMKDLGKEVFTYNPEDYMTPEQIGYKF